MSLDPTSVPANWHENPSNGLSRVHECDRRQTTDHAAERCVAIGERLVIFKEERVGRRARVTTDEDRVLRGVWREIKSYR